MVWPGSAPWAVLSPSDRKVIKEGNNFMKRFCVRSFSNYDIAQLSQNRVLQYHCICTWYSVSTPSKLQKGIRRIPDVRRRNKESLSLARRLQLRIHLYSNMKYKHFIYGVHNNMYCTLHCICSTGATNVCHTCSLEYNHTARVGEVGIITLWQHNLVTYVE